MQADSSLAELVRAAHGGNGKQAARLAVQLSAQSFEWCGGVTGTNDRLMVLDLAGMTGWLRSRGVHLAWPGDVHVAARGVSNALVRRHHPELASRLERSVAALVSTTESPQGDIRPATRLLDLVDEIEKVVR